MKRFFLCIALAGILIVPPSLHAQTKEFADAKLAWTLPWDADWVTAVSFVGNDHVAAGNKLGDLLIWQLPAIGEKAPMPLRRLLGHSNEVNRLVTTPDQKTLISASNDRTVKYWDMTSDSGDKGVVVLNARARENALAKKKKEAPAVEANVVVQKASKELLGHKDWVLGLSLSADGKTLVTGDDKGVVIAWDALAAKELRRWQLSGWAWGLGIS